MRRSLCPGRIGSECRWLHPPRQVLEAAFLAGQKEAVRLFEIVELNPLYDRDNQTARLAATIITAYLTGVPYTGKG